MARVGVGCPGSGSRSTRGFTSACKLRKINLTIFPLHQTSSSMTQAIAGPSRPSSKTSGPIAIYNHSSQHVHYTVSEQELSSMSYTSSTLQPPLPLSSEEAILLQNYYLLRLPLLAKAFGLPERLLATAMSYFKRVWLFGKRNVGEPLEVGAGQRYRGGRGVKVVMLTSLYLATKTHSVSIPLTTFAARLTSAPPDATKESKAAAIQETEDSIKDSEFEIASILGWRFRVEHSCEAVRGIGLDLQTSGFDPPLSPQLYKSCHVGLQKTSHLLRLTGVEFVYTPSQIGFANWWAQTKQQSELKEEERRDLKDLLGKWARDKEKKMADKKEDRKRERQKAKLPVEEEAEEVAAFSADTLLSQAEEIVSTYLSQGQQLEANLKRAETLEKVKTIDLKLKEWTQQRSKLLNQQQQHKRKNDTDEGQNGTKKSRRKDQVDSDSD